MIENKAKCAKCGDIIESKSRHEFVSCSCGAIFVDGGTDYIRRGGNPEDFDKEFDKELDIKKEPQVKVDYKDMFNKSVSPDYVKTLASMGLNDFVNFINFLFTPGVNSFGHFYGVVNNETGREEDAVTVAPLDEKDGCIARYHVTVNRKLLDELVRKQKEIDNGKWKAIDGTS